MCDGNCESYGCIECGGGVDSCCAAAYRGGYLCPGCADIVEGVEPSIFEAFNGCDGPHASAGVVAWLVRSILKGYGYHTDGRGLAKLTDNSPPIYADVFDGRERYVGHVTIYSDTGKYTFSFVPD